MITGSRALQADSPTFRRQTSTRGWRRHGGGRSPKPSLDSVSLVHRVRQGPNEWRPVAKDTFSAMTYSVAETRLGLPAAVGLDRDSVLDRCVSGGTRSAAAAAAAAPR